MEHSSFESLLYKRFHFVTRLPATCLYSRSHGWIARHQGGLWRVGLTKFGTRMLGETVDHAFQVEIGTPVRPGQPVGWIEGFKATTDLYCIAEGNFAGGNALLDEKLDLVNDDPFGAGWLYAVDGTPDAECLDVHGYTRVLDEAIDRFVNRWRSKEAS